MENNLEGYVKIPETGIGDLSDGYHTFNQLYNQRAILFAALVNLNQNHAWKSWRHEDGKYCFDSNMEWFIVGIDTPCGSYTYHYEKKYWDLFNCRELECGKHWDGHTEEDVTRLLDLRNSCNDEEKETIRKALNNYFSNAGEFLTYDEAIGLRITIDSIKDKLELEED